MLASLCLCLICGGDGEDGRANTADVSALVFVNRVGTVRTHSGCDYCN